MNERPELGAQDGLAPNTVVDAAIPDAALVDARLAGPVTLEPPIPEPGLSAAAIPDAVLADEAIVARVLTGDSALFELVMRRYNRLLFRLARGILRDDDEARDVVQAAYVRAYYHLGQFRGPAGFKAWLARIAVNEALGRVRRAPPIVDAEQHALALTDLPEAEPENAASSRDLLRILQAAIDTLPDEFRRVFMLRGVEQLSIAETAELLEINPATVKTRFHRARRMLQEQLQRTLDDVVPTAFPFGGQHCDAIVGTVLARIRCQ
ncbi:MAG TPA: RNA polymerase sigma factor [Gammaproteobacteria bacterium]|nr:RNA polymerase sigma factor [Gammaproteobacteria bacterium]